MGVPVVLAAVTLLVASGLMIWYFVTESTVVDRVSNWVFLAFYGLMAWTVIETHRFYAEVGSWMWVIAVVVVAALVGMFVATFLVASEKVAFTKVATAVTSGFMLLVLWMLLISILVLTQGGLPVGLGWLGVVVMAIAGVAISLTMADTELRTGVKVPSPGLNVLFGVVLVGLTVWIGWLGLATTSPL